MLILTAETTRLAERLAAKQGVPVDEVVKRAIEQSARAAGIDAGTTQPRRRQTVEEMLAAGAEIAAMPLLDRRTPQEIMDDLNTP